MSTQTISPPFVTDSAIRSGELLVRQAEIVRDNDYYLANYGITLAEAQQPVQHQGREDILAEVLENSKCPLGGWVKEAYQEGLTEGGPEGGREAVAKKFALFGQISTEFTVVLQEEDPSSQKKK